MKFVLWGIIILALVFLVIVVLVGIFGNLTSVILMEKKEGSIVKRVLIAGNPHVGTKDYWNEYQSVLEDFDGDIFCEAVWKGGGLDPVMDPFRRLADYLGPGIIYLDEGMQFNPGWIKSDISMEELKEFFSGEDLKKMAAEIDSVKGVPYVLVRFLLGLAAIRYNYFDKNDPLVIRRNEKPVNDAIERLKYIDGVGISYGETHCYGMVEDFEDRGYKVVSWKRLNPFM